MNSAESRERHLPYSSESQNFRKEVEHEWKWNRNWKDAEKESKKCYEEVRSKDSGLRGAGASQHTQWPCLLGTEVNKD